jgi:galactose mutarotase-like enzyme
LNAAKLRIFEGHQDRKMGQIRLRSGDSLAEISATGAEVLQWAVAGHSLLWQSDPRVWAETAPILFPVVGWTRNGQIRVGNKSYPLGLHGFARSQRFSVQRLTQESVRLVLDSDRQTLALYPFDFRFCVDYSLQANSLIVELAVFNLGEGPMPFACGLHPGFCWPLSGETQNGHRILFDRQERNRVPEITPQGLFSARFRPVPLNGTTLDLAPGLFAKEAMCFLNVESRGLRYEAGDGAMLRMEMEGFSHIAFWSKPDARFIALEVWTGHGDPDGFNGDLFAKPSMTILRPGASAVHRARFSFSKTQPVDHDDFG